MNRQLQKPQTKLPAGWDFVEFGVMEKQFPDGRYATAFHPQLPPGKVVGFDDTRWIAEIHSSYDSYMNGDEPQKRWNLAAVVPFYVAREVELIEPYIIPISHYSSLGAHPDLLSNARRILIGD